MHSRVRRAAVIHRHIEPAAYLATGARPDSQSKPQPQGHDANIFKTARDPSSPHHVPGRSLNPLWSRCATRVWLVPNGSDSVFA